MAQVLSLEEFSNLDAQPEPSISNKKVLSLSEFEHIGSTEEAITTGTPDPRFELEQDLYRTMSKGSPGFFENVSESFKIGNDSSNIEMMEHHALLGEIDYDTDVKSIRDKFDKRVADNPIDGGNVLSDAIYSISGMLPAMGKGLAEGKTVGMASALVVSATGPVGVAASPAAFAIGDMYGSMNYWYKIGSGSLYGELKREGLDDGISVPIAHMAGAMYGAIEFSQVDKLMPGSKEVIKGIIVKNVKNTVAQLVKRYGVNWATEVSEEVLQDVLMTTSKNIATNIGEKTNDTVASMAEKAMVSGWNTAKKSAIPMLLLMTPGAAIDSKRAIDEAKSLEQAEVILESGTEDILPVATEEEVEPVSELEVEDESEQATSEALNQASFEFQEQDAMEQEEVKSIEESKVYEQINSADSFNEFENQAESEQPITEDLQRISETDEFQNKAERVSELQGTIDTFNAKKQAQEDEGTIKIRRFKGGYLSEELSEIPKKFFTTNENALTLDELANQWNVSLDEAIQILKSQAITKEDISKTAQAKKELAEIEAEMKMSNPQIEEAVSSITSKSPKLKLTQSQIIKRLFKERFKGQREGFREGRKKGQEEVKSSKQILEKRRQMVKGLSMMLDLSDNEMKKVSRKDIRLMSNKEFSEHIDNLQAMATTMAEKREVKDRIAFEIQEKNLKGVRNLRKALKLPSIDKMDMGQLNEFEKLISEYQAEDEFLTTRQLETVKNTELAGVKTFREVKEIFAKKKGIPLESLNNVDVSQFDILRFDAALADKNPFYKLMVDETNIVLLDAEQQFLEMEKEVDKLASKARASGKQELVDKAVPTDEAVAEYLEADSDKKKELASALSGKMTDAELDFATYVRTRLEQFKNYLLKAEMLEKFKLDYMPHVRRGFFESWKEDGVLKAFKEMFSQQEQDSEMAKALENISNNVLALEADFKFAKKRSGKLKPSKNVSKAFKLYAKAFFKKQALDRLFPVMEIYAYSLSPKVITKQGLETDARLKNFLHQWLNNKKGIKSNFGGLVPQGGKIDIGLRVTDGFITLLDLGLNIPVGLTVSVGEQVAEFVNLGTKKYSLGVTRMNTKKGRQIINANRAFIGKSPWRGMVDTADSLDDKFHKALFLLFETSQVRANKVHLLGSLSKEEWANGKIDPQRLAELKLEIARFRAVHGAKSIIGSTSVGSTLTKYKSWAIPIARTVVRDLGTVSGLIKNGDKSRATQELLRATLVTTLVFLAGRGLVDDDDDSFFGEIIRKAYRESLSILGSLDPTVYTSVRLASFLKDLSESIKMIVTLEEYQTKEGLKGPAKLGQTLTPKVLKQVLKDDSGEGRIG